MNPFEVLGVEPTVDDAGVKRAYAKKVREHPPETDAEGFQRVYEAFELLRDSEGRARAARHLDRATGDADAETLRRLEEAEALAAAGDLEAAAGAYDALTRRVPQLDTAWESLVALLERGAQRSAGDVALRWARARPQNLVAQLEAARLKTVTFDYDDVREVLRVANELAPHDRRVMLARADLHRTREEWDAALTEIASALSLPAEHVSDARLRGCRLRVHLERGNLEQAQIELARIEDPALLTAMGAVAVQLRRHDIAAELFGRARQLDARRAFMLPASFTAKLNALPAATQEFLRERLANPPRRKLEFLYLVGERRSPLLVAGAVVFAAAIVGGTWVGSVGGVLGLIGAVLMIAGLIKGSEKVFIGFLELRPFHLVHCTFDEVSIVPLLRISATKTDGNRIAVFVERRPAFAYESGDRTERFADAVLAQRARLETLAEADLLETELPRETVIWACA